MTEGKLTKRMSLVMTYQDFERLDEVRRILEAPSRTEAIRQVIRSFLKEKEAE